MARMTAIEYAQAVRWRCKLVTQAPFATSETGDVYCFYCHEWQRDVRSPQHNTGCPWDAAHDFLCYHGVITGEESHDRFNRY